jgi:hypothetical protein
MYIVWKDVIKVYYIIQYVDEIVAVKEIYIKQVNGIS